MTRHDDTISLRHMLDHSREAAEMLVGVTRDQFDRDRRLQLALTRLLEIVGEAANRVSQECRDRYPSIPWRVVIGMRNRLIHGYDMVDVNVLWDTATDDLPGFIAAVETAVKT